MNKSLLVSLVALALALGADADASMEADGGEAEAGRGVGPFKLPSLNDALRIFLSVSKLVVDFLSKNLIDSPSLKKLMILLSKPLVLYLKNLIDKMIGAFFTTYLGSNADNEFYDVIDDLAPIQNMVKFMARFNNSESIARAKRSEKGSKEKKAKEDTPLIAIKKYTEEITPKLPYPSKDPDSFKEDKSTPNSEKLLKVKSTSGVINVQSIDEDRTNIAYEMIGAFFTTYLGSNADNEFYDVIDDLAPIQNMVKFMARFNNSESIASRHLNNNENLLRVWDLESMKKYEICKSEYINLKETAATLKYFDDQEKATSSFFDKFSKYKSKYIDLNSGFIEMRVRLEMDGVTKEFTSFDTVQEEVSKRMRVIWARLELFALYARCVKELIRINQSNRVKMMVWQKRLRNEGDMSWQVQKTEDEEAGRRSRSEAPQSRVHKKFIQSLKK